MTPERPTNQGKKGTVPICRNGPEGASHKWGLSPFSPDESLRALFDAACSDTITDEQYEQLEAALSASEDARRQYLRYFTLTGELRYLVSMAHADEAARARTGREYGVGDRFVETPSKPFRPTAPEPPFPVGLLQGMAGCLSQDWTRAYLLAAVVLGLFLLVASFVHVSHSVSVDRAGQLAEAAPATPGMEFVGRIIGMVDCRWADPQTEAYAGASVPLGRKYALSSGLMEITYTTGAKVILQGPCTYEVESGSGGYLALGKLTARIIEERGERREERAKSQAANLKSPVPRPPPPAPLFFVRTPTAVVTDLGTEFGVEVSEEGNTTSHVFRGSVQVKVIENGFPSPSGRGVGNECQVVQLGAGESARVEKVEGAVGSRLVRLGVKDAPPKFARRLVEPPKLLDLLDIVAGGNGLGKRRERGIDPTTGKQDTWFLNVTRKDDHGYHPVTWNRLVDGVFIPYVPPPQKIRIVQLDSSGNIFDRFTECRFVNGKPRAYTIKGKATGSIWARPANVSSADGAWNRDGWVYALTNGEKYMPDGRGLLGLHANAGITFDLEAMRKMFKDVRPARFRTRAGMGDGPRKYPDVIGMADLWIFVDGRLKWKRLDICCQDGAIKVDIPLGPEDRFLTLVSTNGRNGQAYDWIVLGDPTLEMAPTGQDESPIGKVRHEKHANSKTPRQMYRETFHNNQKGSAFHTPHKTTKGESI